MDDNFTLNTNILDNLANPSALVCCPEDCPKYLTTMDKSLTILTQNIRSAWCNFDSFSTVLARIGLLPDVVVLTECWLSINHHPPPLDGYIASISNNNTLQNDGVIVYIKNNIPSQSFEPSFHEANCLVTIIESTAIVSIYRSPSYKSIDKFLASINSLLESLRKYKNQIIIGDINIDIKPNSNDRHAEDYLNMLSFHGFWPSHTVPTRDKSCLDHVIVKSVNTTLTLVMETTITDHDTILFSLNSDLVTRKRDMTNPKINYAAVSDELSNVDFGPIMDSEDCNFATDYMVRCVSEIVARNTTLVKIPRNKVALKPWMTPGLLRCVKHRDKLHLKLKRDPDNTVLRITYCRYRNFFGKLIKKMKKQYNRCELEHAGNSGLKKTWEVINKITNRKSKSVSAQDILSSESSAVVAINKTNAFFANIGKNLADKIAVKHKDVVPQYSCQLTSPSDSLSLSPTDPYEISLVIDSLKPLGSVGWDNIPAAVVKQNKMLLIGPLAHICNLSFTSGKFPTAFKKAIIIPVHKTGDRALVNNYRPISILPTLSKILERLLNKRLVAFLESRSLLSANQFGFRSGKSTADAVSQLTNFIASGLDSGKKCLGIFLDLAKAFDTVSVPLLIRKLEHSGVRGIPLELFGDYLSNRVQVVRIGKLVSDPLPVTYGVPQGSILGPTLFLLYVNELCNLPLHKGKIVTFADDTALLFQGENWIDTFNSAQIGFDKVNAWLLSNTLTLNADKTKYMTFSIRKPRVINPSFKILAHTCFNRPTTQGCDCPNIDQVNEIKYLGVIIDSKLTFKSHIAALTVRVRRLMAIFGTLRHIADPRLLKMVYYTLCQSILTYCITSWGGTCKTFLLPLERAQRAILKVSTFKPIRFPTAKIHKECGILTVRQLFIMNSILRIHSTTVFPSSTISCSSRRSYAVVSTDFYKTSFAKRFEFYLGGYLYNLANKLHSIHTLNRYEVKSILFKWLLPLNYVESENLLISVYRK
ncbi:hypothetical protein JYU34_022109 [Plutella xylostella]|uniref:Reverse transcriptase domain-containing protein n=1 Tax=Plutella xylostella TaxID=51655 RepID=A0ABQ7PQC5_PLUXY|nr:hypothetical protein JYU34_022109 [Plutella xylostella]